ncbi:MAG: copper chaperone PCu(A)C [Caldimonas sp.]
MKTHLIAAMLLLCAAAVPANEYRAGSLTIDHPYARPTAPSQPTGGGYMKIINKGADDRLVSASTPAAAAVQMHSMQMDGNVMRMREVAAIDIPAGKTVELKPGSLHLMLTGLKAPLAVAQSFPLKLKFEKAGEVTVDLKVDAPAAAEMHHTH